MPSRTLQRRAPAARVVFGRRRSTRHSRSLRASAPAGHWGRLDGASSPSDDNDATRGKALHGRRHRPRMVIGMSDGLTVPFALAAGLTGAISQTHLIVKAGFAEIAAGSIAMGLGGYLAARGDAEQYAYEQARECTAARDTRQASFQPPVRSPVAMGGRLATPIQPGLIEKTFETETTKAVCQGVVGASG